MEQTNKAIYKFIENWEEKENITGVLLSGSYAVGNPSKNSDVDVIIILSDNVNVRNQTLTSVNIRDNLDI